MKYFIGVRLIQNLKWGRRDRKMTQSGSYYNRGFHSKYVKTHLKKHGL